MALLRTSPTGLSSPWLESKTINILKAGSDGGLQKVTFAL